MKHIVLGTKILVKRLEAVERSEGGIYLPSVSQEPPLEGRIIEMGIGFAPWGTDPTAPTLSPHKEMAYVKEGDRVLFDHWAGTPIKLGNEEFLVLNQEDILIVLERS